MTERVRAIAAIVLFLLGAGTLVVFDRPATRVVGVGLSLAAIVSAASAILTPARLGQDGEGSDFP